MTDHAVIGQRLPRVDGWEKVTASALYAADVKLPGMLYGKVLRSIYPHARILRIDTSQATKIPGVAAVVTINDVPQHRTGLYFHDRRIFAKERALYIGEELAAVAAIDEETAQRAVEAIDVEYQELPAVFDAEAAMKEGAPILHEDLARYSEGALMPPSCVPGTNICSYYKLRRGDIERGFREADRVFEESFRVQRLHHGYIEPHACVTSYDPVSGRLTVWSSNQGVFQMRVQICHAFNLPLKKVRVIGTRVGGGFGGKTRLSLEPFCVALSMKTKRPVRMVLSREEEISRYSSPSAVIRMKMGANKDGAITALHVELIWDPGAYAGDVGYNMGAQRAAAGPYVIPNVGIDTYMVYTNNMPATSWRAVAMPQSVWAFESMIDIVASGLGVDALELRLKNLAEDGSLNAMGQVLQSVSVKDCLRKAAEAIGWGRNAGPNRGLGLAAFHKFPAPGFGSSAVVKLEEDGTAVLLTGAAEIGQGCETILSQVAAEELGIRLDDVFTPMPDTDLTPYEWGAIGERITTSAGNAVRRAAADAREQALQLAARMMEVKKEDLTIRDGRVVLRDAPQRGISLAEVSAAAHGRFGGPIIGRGAYAIEMPLAGNTETGQLGGLSPSWKYGAHAAEVAVDPETGAVKIEKLVCAHDVGKALNPILVDGQTQGAATMGVGLTLYEKILFDSGKVLNPTFMDYRMPTALDVPPIESIIVEKPAPDGPFGAKAAGEHGTLGVAPAVGNAIYNAVGVRLRELPLTPEDVLAALEQKASHS
ncbi:MAG: xanthine dehydrogenase family protein molybdopterin-binding subunit [Chloroflexi bacterium]|nr:xanthine dehydrogenase family protein molybdopterin-binding subunit [Chloroflexota bacterium]